VNIKIAVKIKDCTLISTDCVELFPPHFLALVIKQKNGILQTGSLVLSQESAATQTDSNCFITLKTGLPVTDSRNIDET